MGRFIAIAHVVSAAALLTAGVLAHAQSLKARTGTWETTSTVALSGNLVPPEALAKLSPEQRAMVEKMMAEHAGNGRTAAHKGCLKKEDLDQGKFPGFGESCKVEVISRSATHLVLKNSCAGNEPSGTVEVTLKDEEHAIGKVEQTTPAGARIHGTFTSKWLSATCAGGR